MHALGMSRTAQVKRDARMGEAEARRDAGIRVSQRISNISECRVTDHIALLGDTLRHNLLN